MIKWVLAVYCSENERPALESVDILLIIVPWCNGSTPDFGSVCPGSSPGGTTKDLCHKPLKRVL